MVADDVHHVNFTTSARGLAPPDVGREAQVDSLDDDLTPHGADPVAAKIIVVAVTAHPCPETTTQAELPHLTMAAAKHLNAPSKIVLPPVSR